MVNIDGLRGALRTGWNRAPERLTPLRGPGRLGWEVQIGDERYVASLAAVERMRAEAGLAAAEWLRERGVTVGGPVRAADGALTVAVPDGYLALSYDIPGRPLDATDPLDQLWWGELLGRVHRELTGFHHPGLLSWHWVRPDAPHLDLEEWLRPAVTAAVAGVTRLTVTDQLTYGVLHAEPLARAFRIDVETGRTGLTGWGCGATGPLVYDLAAAALDAGGPEGATSLLDGYAGAGPVPRDEIDAALPVMIRFRWAVRADRCARRLTRAAGQPAGCPAEVERLAAARAILAAACTALTAN